MFCEEMMVVYISESTNQRLRDWFDAVLTSSNEVLIRQAGFYLTYLDMNDRQLVVSQSKVISSVNHQLARDFVAIGEEILNEMP